MYDSAVGTYVGEKHSVKKRAFGRTKKDEYLREEFAESTQIKVNVYTEGTPGNEAETTVTYADGTEVAAKDGAIYSNVETKKVFLERNYFCQTRSSGFFCPKIHGDPLARVLALSPQTSATVDRLIHAASLSREIIHAATDGLEFYKTLSADFSAFDSWLALAKIGVGRYASSFGFSDFTTTTEVSASHQLQSMFKFERLSVDNDFIHTDGIWQADVANINTKELKIEATEDEFKTRTTTDGFSLTFAPRSILSRATGALPAVQIVDSEGFQRSAVFNTTGFNFGRGQITVDNVRLHGGTIAGGDLDVEIERDLLVEYFVNTSESWSRSHSVGFDLSTVGSLGMSGLPSFREPFSMDNLRQLGATLNAPPTVRAEHIESIHQTYSDAGIKTSKGFNVGGQTAELKPYRKNEDKIKVFDSSIINSIGENLTAVGQLRDAYQSIGNGAYSEPKFDENDAEFEGKIKAKNQKKRLEIIDKLLDQGATKTDIVEIFNNLNIDEQIDASTRMSYRYGGMAIQLLDSQANTEYQQAETNSFLRDSLELFSDAAVELSDFAEKFPHLVDYSLTAMQLAFGGPTRLLFDKFKETTGIQAQIDSCKEVVYDWIGDKVSEISGLDKATSDMLVSSGRFGIGFGFMACGLQSKNGILKDAKKVATKKAGRSGKQARLKEIMNDDKVSSAWRGWLKQDAKAMKRDIKARPGLRVPPGTQLAHKRGFEAAKGYDYSHSDLKTVDIHKIQHKCDKMGKLNQDGGKK